MKKCPFCAELIQDEAVVCRYCNRELPVQSVPVITAPKQPAAKKKMSPILILLLVGLACVLGLCFLGWASTLFVGNEKGETKAASSSSSSKRFTTKSDATLEEDYQTLWSTGLLKKTELNHYFYVDPFLWNGLNIDAKRGVCYVLADYIATKGETGWVEIYDYQSGKKVAKLGVWGFDTY